MTPAERWFVIRLNIVELLKQTSLEEIDAAIAEKAIAVEKLQGEIASLKMARRTVNVFQNGKPERKKPVRKDKTPKSASEREDTSELGQLTRILRNLGGCTPSTLAAKTGLGVNLIIRTFNAHPDKFYAEAGGIWKVRT